MLTSVHVPLFIDTYFVQSQSEEHKGKGLLETVRGTTSSVPSRLEVPHMELTSWPTGSASTRSGHPNIQQKVVFFEL